MIRYMGLGAVDSLNAVLARSATIPVRLSPGRPQVQRPEQNFQTDKIRSQRFEDKAPLALESTPKADKYTLLKELARERVAPIGRDQSHRASGYRGLQEAASKIFGGKEKYQAAFRDRLEGLTGIKQDRPGAREDALIKANKSLFDQAFLQSKIAGFGQLEKLSPEEQLDFYNNLIALAGDKANKSASKFESLMADKKNGPAVLTNASVDFTIAALFIKEVQKEIKAIESEAKSQAKTSVGRRLAAA